jgi:AbrB family looped-hinge helix DNA binding protein
MAEIAMIHGSRNGNVPHMNKTIQMDASGRLVLPKALRNLLNLRGRSRLRVEVVAGCIELMPVAAAGEVVNKGGIAVLARTGTRADAATAVAAERAAQNGRGLRR